MMQKKQQIFSLPMGAIMLSMLLMVNVTKGLCVKQDMGGEWINVNFGTEGIVRFTLEFPCYDVDPHPVPDPGGTDDRPEAYVHVYAAGYPSPTDHGRRAANHTFMSTENNNTQYTRVDAKYVRYLPGMFRQETIELVILQLSKDRLMVFHSHAFSYGSDDYSRIEYFEQSSSTGACCYSDGSCRVATLQECWEDGATWRGTGTQCLGDNNSNGIDDICEPELDSMLTVTSEATIRGPRNSYQVAISPCGEYVLVGDEQQEMVTFATWAGTVLWRYSLPTGIQMEDGAISENGDLTVVGGQGGSLFALSKTGNLLWKQDEPTGELPVAMTETGNKIYTESSGILYCYNGNGNKLWERTVNTRGWTVWGISTTPSGGLILLRTNSDVIICDGLGNEIAFFDIVPGNHLIDADISDYGDQFVVHYTEEKNGTTEYCIALCSFNQGKQWKRMVESFAGVRIDSFGRVFSTCRNGFNRLWDNAGNLLLIWDDGGVNLDIDRAGSRCIVGQFPKATVYRVSTEQ